MPTNDSKKVVLNGEKVEPVKKTTLPPSVDWQKIAREKQSGG